jgi:hypothetical protein
MFEWPSCCCPKSKDDHLTTSMFNTFGTGLMFPRVRHSEDSAIMMGPTRRSFYTRRKSLNKSGASRAWTERAPTRLGTVDWVHTTHQPRSRSPSIVGMLKTRNSWRRLPQNRNRRTTDDRPRRVSQSRRRPQTRQGRTGKSSWQSVTRSERKR